MQNVIWKYALRVTEDQTVTMPLNAMLVHAGIQGGILMVWASVDPKYAVGERKIRVRKTGHYGEVCDRDGVLWKHVGTVLHDGLVWHVEDAGFV